MSRLASLKTSTVSLLSSGSLDCICRPNIRESGVAPVVTCGVDLYAVNHEISSKRQFFFSRCTIFIHLSKEWFWRSTSPLAAAHNGVVVRCSTPYVRRNASNSPETNCGPLSVRKESGTPNQANTGEMASMILAVVVDFKMATSTNLLK